MNRPPIPAAVTIAVILLAGCTTGGQPLPSEGSPTDGDPATTGTHVPTDTATGTRGSTDTATRTHASTDTTARNRAQSGGSSTTTPADTETTSADDPQYTIRVTLIRRFDPGTTFGMPTAHTNETIEAAIEEQPHLAEKLSETFNTSSRRELFTRLEQYNQIRVSKRESDGYSFSIRDGNACTITTINGTYHANGSISHVTNSSESVPC